MNKFIIDEAANELLECWRIAHADSIRSCITEAVWYFDRFELVFRSKEREISGFCERHQKFFEVKLYEQGVRTATLKLRASEKPGEDVTMQMVPNKSLVNMDDPEQREHAAHASAGRAECADRECTSHRREPCGAFRQGGVREFSQVSER